MAGHMIITLDGPAGVGKSTLAKDLARSFDLPFLDTGAMFRCIAFHLGAGALGMPEQELEAALGKLEFSLEGQGLDAGLACNGVRPGLEIRSEEIGGLASKLAALGPVREYLKLEQQKIGRDHSLVAEGRDMGTVIFPEACCKFFLDADPRVRAERRCKQLAGQGKVADLEVLEEQIRQRDHQDRTRGIAPLKAADDAVIVDTTHMSRERVLRVLLDELKNKGFEPPSGISARGCL